MFINKSALFLKFTLQSDTNLHSLQISLINKLTKTACASNDSRRVSIHFKVDAMLSVMAVRES